MVEAVRAPAAPATALTPQAASEPWHPLYQGLCDLYFELSGPEGVEKQVAHVSGRAPLSVVAREYAQVPQNDFSTMPLVDLYRFYTEVRAHRELLNFVASGYAWGGVHQYSDEVFSAWFGSFYYIGRNVHELCSQLRKGYTRETGLYFPSSEAPWEISAAEAHLAQAVLARLPSADKDALSKIPDHIWRGTLLRRVNMSIDGEDGLRIVSFNRNDILGGRAYFTHPRDDVKLAFDIAVNGVRKDWLYGRHRRPDPILIGVPFESIKGRFGISVRKGAFETVMDPDAIASISGVRLYYPK